LSFPASHPEPDSPHRPVLWQYGDPLPWTNPFIFSTPVLLHLPGLSTKTTGFSCRFSFNLRGSFFSFLPCLVDGIFCEAERRTSSLLQKPSCYTRHTHVPSASSFLMGVLLWLWLDPRVRYYLRTKLPDFAEHHLDPFPLRSFVALITGPLLVYVSSGLPFPSHRPRLRSRLILRVENF